MSTPYLSIVLVTSLFAGMLTGCGSTQTRVTPRTAPPERMPVADRNRESTSTVEQDQSPVTAIQFASHRSPHAYPTASGSGTTSPRKSSPKAIDAPTERDADGSVASGAPPPRQTAAAAQPPASSTPPQESTSASTSSPVQPDETPPTQDSSTECQGGTSSASGNNPSKATGATSTLSGASQSSQQGQSTELQSVSAPASTSLTPTSDAQESSAVSAPDSLSSDQGTQGGMPTPTATQGVVGPSPSNTDSQQGGFEGDGSQDERDGASSSPNQGWKVAPSVEGPSTSPNHPRSVSGQAVDVAGGHEVGVGDGDTGRRTGQSAGASGGGGGHSSDHEGSRGGDATDEVLGDAPSDRGAEVAAQPRKAPSDDRPFLSLQTLAEAMADQGSDADAHALPEIDDVQLDDIPTQTTAADVETPSQITERMRGVWRLVNAGDDDFLPSGADQRFLGIDPTRGEIITLLSWKRGEVVLMAEYTADISDEVIVIHEPEDRASRLPGPGQLLPGGVQFTNAPTPGPWTLNWGRSGTSLRIGESLYVAEDPDIVDTLMRGKAFSSSDTKPAMPLGPAAGTQPRAEPASVDFFGVQSEGRFVCYVIDVSGSMVGQKLDRLKQELRQSISSLPREVSFAVVFFSSDARVIVDRWTQSQSAAASSVLRSIRGVNANGGTDPARAFQWAFGALEPAPDTLFFMTDGTVATPDLPGLLRSLNARQPRARIHTIGFGADADIGLLQSIAQQHGGTFNVVP